MQSRFLKAPLAAYLSSSPPTTTTTTMTASTTATALAAAADASSIGNVVAGTKNRSVTTSTLDHVRSNLVLPTREETLRRDSKVYEFWNTNDKLLEKAWKEWDNSDPKALKLPTLDDSIINPKLRDAMNRAWEIIGSSHNEDGMNVDPTGTCANDNDDDKEKLFEEIESNIKDLWEEVVPGVYAIQFFDLNEIHKIQEWFAAVSESGIPTRPPYGIVLNRQGFMIDPRSIGYLGSPKFQDFYMNTLINSYVRPLGRLFYPKFIQQHDDSESFAFSIQYQAGGDESIRHHTDASTITFNINLDLEQTWTGSSLYFWNSETHERNEVEWKPGYAIMHLGRTLHAATPIKSGTRSNLVMWTFGTKTNMAYGSSGSPLTLDDGSYPEEYQMKPQDRWTKPSESSSSNVASWDRWSPF